MTGGELLEEIRAGDSNRDVPFLMLTARADANSVRSAINARVTDYIVKPFDKNSLLKKVSAALDDVEHSHAGESKYAGHGSEEHKKSVYRNVMSLVKPGLRRGT